MTPWNTGLKSVAAEQQPLLISPASLYSLTLWQQSQCTAGRQGCTDAAESRLLQTLSKEGLATLGPTVAHMAALEGLDAHKRAVTLRLDALRKDS
jgi:Histidinol dehydrogenase